MSRLSYGGSKWKGSRAVNGSAMSLDGCADVSTKPTQTQPVVGYDNLSEDTHFVFARHKEREDRAQCIGEYMMYKYKKEEKKPNPFDRFLR